MARIQAAWLVARLCEGGAAPRLAALGAIRPLLQLLHAPPAPSYSRRASLDSGSSSQRSSVDGGGSGGGGGAWGQLGSNVAAAFRSPRPRHQSPDSPRRSLLGSQFGGSTGAGAGGIFFGAVSGHSSPRGDGGSTSPRNGSGTPGAAGFADSLCRSNRAAATAAVLAIARHSRALHGDVLGELAAQAWMGNAITLAGLEHMDKQGYASLDGFELKGMEGSDA